VRDRLAGDCLRQSSTERRERRGVFPVERDAQLRRFHRDVGRRVGDTRRHTAGTRYRGDGRRLRYD